MYDIRRADPKTTPDDELVEMNRLGHALSLEVLPDDPLLPDDEFIKGYRLTPDRVRRFAFRAYDDNGRLVATGGTSIDPEHDDNPDLLHVNIAVHPAHRRRGIGTRLLQELVAVAQEEGRSRFVSGTNDTIDAGRAFATAVGAEPKSAAHLNHLPIEAVDRSLMETWVADGPKRAEGYELIGWDDRCPDEHLEQWTNAILVMNTAPRDDLQMNDFTVTPAQMREREEIMIARGVEGWVLVARHIDSGEFAGFHDVMWLPHEPDHVYVGATGVWPAHRGHALGKWLKAAMMLRILDERPNVTDIRTGNADSNDAMLGINHQMGYRPLLAETAWELTVDQAAKWLASRP